MKDENAGHRSNSSFILPPSSLPFPAAPVLRVGSNPKRVEGPAQGVFYDNHALVSLGYWRVIWDE